ncbi:DUF6166 domain-containing protein [Actinoallomurus iriomotensis]|uniref:DUF6166 domain-containing protein n=1 Tax=Actinoallomurus iriomotensis TaxID=478107 RepID=UPI003D7FCB04
MTSVSSHSQHTLSADIPQRPGDQLSADRTTPEIDVHAVYHGWPRPDGTIAVVIESPAGNYKPLPHQIRHSPAGFNCGYNGNGPRDLALSLLTDVLFTSTQEGRLHAPSHGQRNGFAPSAAPPENSTATLEPGRCDIRPQHLPYLYFAEQIVAQLPPDKAWSLSRQEITRWLASEDRRSPLCERRNERGQ